MSKPYPVKFSNLKRKKVFGFAHYGPPPHIEIEKTLLLPGQGRELLGTIVHEAIHLAAEYLEEDAVLKIEEAVANQLWAMGFRRVVE